MEGSKQVVMDDHGQQQSKKKRSHHNPWVSAVVCIQWATLAAKLGFRASPSTFPAGNRRLQRSSETAL